MTDEFDELIAQHSGNNTQSATQPSDEFDNLIAQYGGKGNKGVENQSAFMDAVDAFNNQSRKLANGILQPIAYVTDKLGVTSNASNALAKDTAEYQQYANTATKNSPIAAGIGNVLGALSNAGYMSAFTGGLGFGGYGSGAELGKAGRIAEQGLLGSATSGAEYGDVGQRATGAAIGGAAAAAGQAVLGEALPAVGSWAKGKISQGVEKTFTGNTPQEAADVLNSGGLLTAGMATGNEALEKGEQYLAQLPIVGAKSNYKDIAKNAIDQSKQFLSDQGLPVGKEGIGGASMGDLAQSVNRYALSAEKEGRQIATKKYQLAKDYAEQNNIQISLDNAQSIAKTILQDKRALAKEGFNFAAPSPSEALPLKNFAKGEQVITEDSPLLNEYGGKLIDNPLDELMPTKTISATKFEDVRKALNYRIMSLEKGEDPNNMSAALRQIKQGMDLDLINTGGKIGGAYNTLLKNARNEYIARVTPFKEEPILKRIMAGNVTPDELLNAETMGDKPATAETLMRILPPEGQKIYTKALLLKAANNAIDNSSKKFSAQQFGVELSKMGETLKALPMKTQQVLKGLQSTLARADRPLEEWGKNRVMAPSMSAGALSAIKYMLGATTAGGVAATTKAISYMLTNDKMVRQLVRIGGGELNSKVEAATADHILGTTLKHLGYIKKGIGGTAKLITQGVYKAAPAGLGAEVGNQNK